MTPEMTQALTALVQKRQSIDLVEYFYKRYFLNFFINIGIFISYAIQRRIDKAFFIACWCYSLCVRDMSTLYSMLVYMQVWRSSTLMLYLLVIRIKKHRFAFLGNL